MAKHNVDISGTPFEAALKEIAEDGISEILQHHRNVQVKKAKSKMVITIELMPDGRAELFTYTMGRSRTLAPVESVSDSFYAVFRGDKAEIAFHNPRQERMIFDQPEASTVSSK